MNPPYINLTCTDYTILLQIILGWAGDCKWVNVNVLYAISMTLCGLVISLIPLLKSYEAYFIVSGAFGLFIAANYSLTSIILVQLISLERFTNAYGLLLLVQGVANLIGPPLAGKKVSKIYLFPLLYFIIYSNFIISLPRTHK